MTGHLVGLSCILRMTQDPGSLARQISGVGYRGVCRAETSVEEQHRKCAGAGPGERLDGVVVESPVPERVTRQS